MAKRYKVTKNQLERIVENFVMEAASIGSKKAPTANKIPAQSADVKKKINKGVVKPTGGVKKIEGTKATTTPKKFPTGQKMIEKSKNMPTVTTTQKKKLPQASDAKKHIKTNPSAPYGNDINKVKAKTGNW